MVKFKRMWNLPKDVEFACMMLKMEIFYFPI